MEYVTSHESINNSDNLKSLESVDLSRYPLHRAGSPELIQIIRQARHQLKETGCAILPGFLTEAATALMTSEAAALSPEAFHKKVNGNAYLTAEDMSLPITHPNRMKEDTCVGVIAYDQIPAHHALRQLYENDVLMEFIALILGESRLYRYADPLGALNIAVMSEGEYLRWHFDQTDFVTSIALQSSVAGGDFEYVPFIRSRTEENIKDVRDVLLGARERVVHVPMTPGTLMLFEGRQSLHRVTAVEGSVDRLVALLAYDTKPGVTSTPHLQEMRYGRSYGVR